MLEVLLPALAPILEGLAGKYGTLAQVIMAMGVLRLCMKPIMVALADVIKITPSKKDDAFLAKLLVSPAYKLVCFVLDYLLSIKLPQKA